MIQTERINVLQRWVVGLVLLSILASASHATAQELAMGRRKLPPIDFSDRVVTFPSADGIPIEADFYPVKVKKGIRTPIALLIHMYPVDRSDWVPYVSLFRDAGIAVLAYDIRGRGGSAGAEGSGLKEQYDKQDPNLFRVAWMDAQGAATWLQQQRHIDVNNMVVVGASIGSSVALDFTCRIQNIKVAVCLSPGLNYFGLNSAEHIRFCRKTAILLMSPEGEFEVVKTLKDAGPDNVVAKKYPGGKENHGTAMFAADHGKKAKKRMMSFIRKGLGLPAASKDEEEKEIKPKKKSKKKGKKKGKKKRKNKADKP